MTQIEEFRITVYSKRELAQMYFPSSSPKVAVNQLNRWIKSCRTLTEKLMETNYNKRLRYFTSKQTRLIVEHLGEP